MKLNFLDFPQVLGLSLANMCNGKCIWCPLGRKIYTPRKNRFMPPEIVDRIIQTTYGKPVKEIWFSENGESLFHPQFKDIVAKFRTIFPSVPFGIGTNLSLLTEELMRFILQYGFRWIGFNLDGLTQEAYGAIKGLNVEVAKERILRLLELRDEIAPRAGLHASILTQPHYYDAT